MGIKTLCITFLSLIIILAGCSSPSQPQQAETSEISKVAGSMEGPSFSAKLIIEDPTEGDDVTWPSIRLENTGYTPIDISIDVSVVKDGNIIDKKNGVLFLTKIGGGDTIQKIYPDEELVGVLNYLYQEEIRHNWKLKVELRDGASAKIIASDEKCLSASCDDETLKVTREPILTNAPEWSVFFEECKKQFNPSTFKNSATAGPATDTCEHQYAKDYFKPEYCEKVEDYAIKDECWLDMAIISKDKKYCEEHFKGSKIFDCVRNIQG